MKILLWKIGALGDILMTTPLLRQLRAALPQAQIDYLVGQASAAVLHGNPHVDRVLTFDGTILWHAQAWRLGELLAQLRGYDCIYVLDKHWIFGWLARAAGIPKRIGFRRRAAEGWPHTMRVPYGGLRHEIDCYLDLAEAAGLPVDRSDRRLLLPPGKPLDLPPHYVVAINSGGANPGENTQVRKLPPTLFTGLVEALTASTQVVFVGAPGEHADYEALAARFGARNLCGATTLAQVWYALAHARAVYTTDTGLMHMAGACNERVVATFGPTHPARKCPPGAHWIWRDEDLYDAGYELFGRVPKGRYFQRLTVGEILAALPQGPQCAHAADRDQREP